MSYISMHANTGILNRWDSYEWVVYTYNIPYNELVIKTKFGKMTLSQWLVFKEKLSLPSRELLLPIVDYKKLWLDLDLSKPNKTLFVDKNGKPATLEQRWMSYQDAKTNRQWLEHKEIQVFKYGPPHRWTEENKRYIQNKILQEDMEWKVKNGKQ